MGRTSIDDIISVLEADRFINVLSGTTKSRFDVVEIRSKRSLVCTGERIHES